MTEENAGNARRELAGVPRTPRLLFGTRVALVWNRKLEVLPLSAFVKLESLFTKRLTTCARLALGGISHLISHQGGRDAADNGEGGGRGAGKELG